MTLLPTTRLSGRQPARRPGGLPAHPARPLFGGLGRRPAPVPAPAADDHRGPAAGAEPGCLVAAAVYEGGARTASFSRLADAFRAQRSRPGSLAWVGLDGAQAAEIEALAAELDLHPLVVEDVTVAHQRPKLERSGDTLLVVLRTARYDDVAEQVDFGEVHVLVGPSSVVTVRHDAAPDLAGVRARLEADPAMLARGPEAVLYAVMDAVVDGYAPVVAGLENDVDEIESEVFSGDPDVSRRIYELSREVVDVQRALRPLHGVLGALGAGFTKYAVEEELQRYLRDVADHVAEAVERVDSLRAALRDILTVNATLVAQRQNEEMKALSEASNQQNEEVKKISGWAAILFAPTLVGTVYGMNFDAMPELHWQLGYPFALAAMLAVSVGLFGVFRWKRWI